MSTSQVFNIFLFIQTTKLPGNEKQFILRITTCMYSASIDYD